MEKVFLVSRKKAEEIVGNEEVKRRGEAKYYEARTLGINKEGFLVVVRGPEALFALEIFKDLEEVDEKEKVLE